MRLRQIKKYGNTWVVKLETADIEDYGIIEGDKVDIEDLSLLKEKRGKSKWQNIMIKY